MTKKTKHTPFPWYPSGRGNGICGRWEDGTEVQVLAMSSTQFGGLRASEQSERMEGEDKENKRLILMIPEMLARLAADDALIEQMLEALDRAYCRLLKAPKYDVDATLNTLQTIQDAIMAAKARGNENING